MLRFALLRILSAIPTLFIVIAVAFALIHAAPGGPFDSERVLAPEVQQNIESYYHLDEPLPQQFARYVKGLVHGDLGPSYRYSAYSVSEIIAETAPVSLVLGAMALGLALAAGMLLGLLAALRRNTLLDRIVSAIAMLGISVPVFVIAPLLMMVFAVQLDWLPVSFDRNDGAARFVLPVIALALPLIAYIAKIFRASMIEVLESDFIRTARAQGLSSLTIIRRHAMRPALLPLLSFLGPAIAGLMTGSVVVEQMFGISGLGRTFIESALNRDYTAIMGLVIVYAVLIIVMNLIVDLLYGLVDPRIRHK